LQRAEVLKDMKPLNIGRVPSGLGATLSARSADGGGSGSAVDSARGGSGEAAAAAAAGGGVTARSLSRISMASVYYDASEELEEPLPSSASCSGSPCSCTVNLI